MTQPRGLRIGNAGSQTKAMSLVLCEKFDSLESFALRVEINCMVQVQQVLLDDYLVLKQQKKTL